MYFEACRSFIFYRGDAMLSLYVPSSCVHPSVTSRTGSTKMATKIG